MMTPSMRGMIAGIELLLLCLLLMMGRWAVDAHPRQSQSRYYLRSSCGCSLLFKTKCTGIALALYAVFASWHWDGRKEGRKEGKVVRGALCPTARPPRDHYDRRCSRVRARQARSLVHPHSQSGGGAKRQAKPKPPGPKPSPSHQATKATQPPTDALHSNVLERTRERDMRHTVL